MAILPVEHGIALVDEKIISECPYSKSDWTRYQAKPDTTTETEFSCGSVRSELNGQVDYERTPLCIKRERDFLQQRIATIERELRLELAELLNDVAAAQQDAADAKARLTEAHQELTTVRGQLAAALETIAELEAGQGGGEQQATHFVLTFGKPKLKGT